MLIKVLILVIVPLGYALTQALTEKTHFDGYHSVGHDDALHTPPKVCTQHAGCMVGKVMPGYRIDNFEAFMGIPYALPPIGELRFSHPKSYPRSLDIIDATEPKSDCIQKNALIPNSQVTGSEDCLYLNVYRPSRRRHMPKLPVMVYIHGGGWFAGSVHPDITGPHYLMDTQDVIVVTFSYRLGIFGFLSTNDSIVPGNFGLKDQTLVLKWVQKNIADFGGNPKQVTLFGQSAGAVSAHMHVLSKHSEGLFQGVIALSGTANVPFAIQNDGLEMARQTAVLCNVTNAADLSTAKLVKALRAIDPDALLAASDAMKYWDVDPLTLFRPVVENYQANDAFFTRHPDDIFTSGEYRPVRFMAGIVPGEGAVRAAAIMETNELRNSFNADFDHLLEMFMELPEHFNRTRLDFAVQRIIDEYFEGQHELANPGFVDVITDRGFHHPFYHAIETYVNTLDTIKHPLYLYYFNYTGLHTYTTLYTGGLTNLNYGVVHCDELIYLLRSSILFEDFPLNSIEAEVSAAFVGHLVNFVKNRKPYPKVECKQANFPQNSVDSICDYVLFENGPNGSFVIKTENKFNVRRMHFWDELLQD